MFASHIKTFKFLLLISMLATILKPSNSQGYFNYNSNPYYRRARAYSSYSAAANAAAERLRQLQLQLANTNRLQNSYTNYGANNVAAINTNTNVYRRPHNYDYRNSAYTATTTTTSPYINSAYRQDSAQSNQNSISQADSSNSKFSGTNNQEAVDESSKTFLQLNRRQFSPAVGLCQPYGRGRNAANDLKGEGRFLGINVYNVYAGGGSGCRDGYGGAGGLSDPYQNPYPPTPLNTFLSLFTPVAANRPQYYRPQADPATAPGGAGGAGGGIDPAVDPNFVLQPQPLPQQPPPQQAPITPGQFVGSVATTVNGIIQQLTGNIQPVYPG